MHVGCSLLTREPFSCQVADRPRSRSYPSGLSEEEKCLSSGGADQTVHIDERLLATDSDSFCDSDPSSSTYGLPHTKSSMHCGLRHYL